MKKVVFVLAVLFLMTTFVACTAASETSTAPASSAAAPASSAAAPASSAAAPETAKPAKALSDQTWDEITAAAKSQKMSFFMWWGEDFWTKVCADFSAKYGAEVTFVTGEGTATADKLIAEKALPESSMDLFAVGGNAILPTLNGKVFEENILNLLPEKDKLDPNLSKVQEGVLTNGTLIPLYRNQTGLIYNPEKVKNPPQTWAELEKWIEENPNRFGVCPPEGGGTGQAFVQTAIASLCDGLDQYTGATEADPAKVAKWDVVWKWFTDRKDKVLITKNNADSSSRLNNGELWLTVLWSDDTFIAMSKGELNKNFVFYIPKMGLAGGGDTMGIAANSKNKELALLFASYLTSAEVQLQMSAEINTIPARTDVVVKDTVVKNDELVNSVPWIPACYKSELSKLFTARVLQ